MRYTFQDPADFGERNGLDSGALLNVIYPIAKSLGLELTDYFSSSIEDRLRNDHDLLACARKSFTPFPGHPDWPDEIRALHYKAIEDGCAPGEGEVPDEVVRAKVLPILEELAEDIRVQKAKKERARFKRDKALQGIEYILNQKLPSCAERELLYRRTVHTLAGDTFIFIDRTNVLTGIREISPATSERPTTICKSVTGFKYWWYEHITGLGWCPVRPLPQNELRAYLAVKCCGASTQD